MQYSKQYACEQAVRWNMKKTYWSIMHRVVLIKRHWVKQLSFASTRKWTQLNENQHTYNCYVNTHTIVTSTHIQLLRQHTYNCYDNTHTIVTRFSKFKTPPAPPPHGCDISALYNNQARPWKCDSNGIGWDSGLETCTRVKNFTSCSRNFLQLINILICAHSTVLHVEAQCRGVCEAKTQKQGRS